MLGYARRLKARLTGSTTVPIGQVRFGDLRRVTPISDQFGFDRGKPVDRYYIEGFLKRHAADVRGHVLEIGDDYYTKQFGGDRVTKSDVLHVIEGNPLATIVGDLSKGDNLPSDTFDCMIFTQTLQLIYDCKAAVRTIYRILKPGGIVLATIAGNSRNIGEHFGQGWYWNFTERSGRRLFEDAFPGAQIAVQSHGNVLSTVAFLHGLASQELRAEELDYSDSAYPIVVSIRAVKPTS